MITILSQLCLEDQVIVKCYCRCVLIEFYTWSIVLLARNIAIVNELCSQLSYKEGNRM